MINYHHNSTCPAKPRCLSGRSGSLPREAFRRSGGFSLIEILVVTCVITVGFMAVLGLVRKAIIVYYNNQNYLEAATVAQQGLELTRYIRDDNWLTNNPSTDNIPFFTNISVSNPPDGAKTIFAIDQQAMAGSTGRAKIKHFYNSVAGDELSGLPSANSGNLSAYVKDDRAKILFDEGNNNFYTIDSALPNTKPTIFHNLIQVTYHNNGTPGDTPPSNKEDDYLYVVSMVYWQDRGTDKYFTLATYLYDYSLKY